MKLSATINRREIFHGYSKNRFPKNLLISFITIIIGIICGTIIYIINSDFISNRLVKYFVSFYTEFSGKKFYEIFCGIILSFLSYYILLVIFGTSVLGFVPTIATAFFKAFGMGCLATYIISAYELHGFEYFLLIIFPGKILIIFSLLLLTEMCIDSSQRIKELSEKGSAERFSLNLYLKKSLLILIMMILSALTETICIKLFSSLFELG